MRVLICGDRNWSSMDSIVHQLSRVKKVTLVIAGGAKGADTMGWLAAGRLGLKSKIFSANWEKYGKAAGPIRNQQMLDEGKPDLVLAFHPDLTKSKGTADMVRRAKKANVPVKMFTK